MGKTVLLLFETTMLAAAEFEKCGFDTICIDLDNKLGKWGDEHGIQTNSRILDWDILENVDEIADLAMSCEMVIGFPPCTDLANSGAAHFASKRAKNPNFQIEAVELCRTVETIGNLADVPWIIENPTSVLSTLWRKPDFRFQPYEYGGYLPVDDVHPLYPKYIMPRDAYPKKTCYWTSENLKMPEKLIVPIDKGYSTQYNKLGGKSAKTKRIRSATPRGIMRAIAQQLKKEMQ